MKRVLFRLHAALMEKTTCHSDALEAVWTLPRLRVRGQEEVTSDVFIMTLARIS